MAQEQVSVESADIQLKTGALTGNWTLDTAKTKVNLKTKAMWGLVPVKGTFAAVGGKAEVGTDGAVTATLDVASGSINTKMKKRDEHLRSADFFDSATHPTISVAIDSVSGAGSSLTATGHLTVKGRTLPMTFPITVSELAGDEAALDALVDVDRSDIGLDFRAKGATKMTNTLSVHAVYRRT